jgi:hypothetical protein
LGRPEFRPRVALLAATRIHVYARASRRPALVLCLAVALLGSAPGEAQGSSPVSAGVLDAYIARVARAWEPYTTPDGRVIDPLDRADTSDNYGVIMLADVMLKAAARDGDTTLAETGERIVSKAATLQAVDGPFNLLAIATLLRDGQQGRFPADVWAQIGGAVAALAARISPPSEQGCLTTPGCYNNWRLAWSAGASALLASGVRGAPGTTSGDPTVIAGEITGDLAMATAHAGIPAIPSVLRGARELADPGSEPLSYHLFSCALLELIAEADPAAITPPVERLREQAAHYALELMAPDGQLSLAGRSLDQSWVQAAAAALGARQAAQDPAHAGQWRSFADRAVSYLLSAYPARSDGVVPIVPGLDSLWSPSIMDGYAALNQYEGLTLWFLSDALEHWPQTSAPRAPLPADASSLLVGDLHSSGLVWGRAGHVWWAVSGRTTDSDPRFAQGLVAVKVQTTGGWHDLLALRPRQHGLSSTWTLTLPGDPAATPIFTAVRGSGHRAVLTGSYRDAGHIIAPATWMLSTTASGLSLQMSVPSAATLQTTVWLTDGNPRLSAHAARMSRRACTVTASGRACPVSLRWTSGAIAGLEISQR